MLLMETMFKQVTAFLGDIRASADNSHNINFEKRTNLLYLLKKTNFAGALYVGSVFFITLGIVLAFLVHWDDISQAGRLSIIVLCGINAYLIGSALCFFKIMDSLGQTLWFLSSVVLFWGLVFEFTLIDSLGFANLDSFVNSSGSSEIVLYVTIPLFIAYLASFFAFKRNVLLVSAVFFGVALLQSLVAVIFGQDIDLTNKVTGYLSLVNGCIYIALGYLFSRNEKRYLLTWPFYFFGAVALVMGGLILIDPLALVGPLFLWSVGSYADVIGIEVFDTNTVWIVLYPILALAVASLAFFLRKIWFVIAGLYGLLSYVSYVSVAYFNTNTSSWLILILTGVAMLGAGQAYLYIKRRKVSS